MAGHYTPSRSARPDPLTTVRNVLLHEGRLGYTDRAAVGGLRLFWERQMSALRAADSSGSSLAAIERSVAALAAYATADQAERARTVGGCLALIDALQAAPRRLADASAHPRESSTGARPAAGSAAERSRESASRPPAVMRSATPAAPPTRSPRPSERMSGPPDATTPRATALNASTRDRAPGDGPSDRPAPAPAPPRPNPTPSPRTDSRKASATPRAGGGLESPIASLRGVGPANGAKLAKLGVATVRDLLYHFPTRYIDYRDTRPISALRALGDERYQTIQATVVDVRVERLRGRGESAGQWLFADLPEPKSGRPGLLRVTARLRDETGAASAVWIRAQDYISREFTPGRLVIISGEVHATWRGEDVEFRDPDYEFAGSDDSLQTIHTGRLVPVYRLTQSLGARGLRRLIKLAVDAFAPQVREYLPLETRRAANLVDLPTAIGQIHFPDTPELLDRARRRLVFDEFFLVQYSLLERREELRSGPPSPPLAVGRETVERFVEALPFALTGAQRRTLDEVIADVAESRPMSRLVQGDVGSGKTVVAAAATLLAVANGCQAAIMAPTEILAEQHFRTFTQLIGEYQIEIDGAARPVRIGLLVGSQKLREKRATRLAIADGEIDIIVGTQALIQESVEFHRLGLAVVDEQHRFGVLQRGALRDKGGDSTAHLLVMTATPIPRTLALTVYGDLDLSIIDELPPGRQEIRTKCFGPDERSSVYEGLRHEIRAGHQAYIICPLVEESERLAAKAATAEYERLSSEVFTDLRLGLLHGKMKPAEKEAAMRAFQAGETDVLVATAVVEVGVDVSNATFMIIEGADRFGLAQLHQFRGRIGRGTARSYCALLAASEAAASRERIEIVARTKDGFRLAEADLQLRGPGEFFGTRQSGLPDLKLARPGDEAILEEAREVASHLFATPSLLHSTEREALTARIGRLWDAGEQH